MPDGVDENYVYEYDSDFKFLKKHIIKSGHTHLGIQTETFAHDRWRFDCYGDPKVMLVTDADFQMKDRYKIDCSLGVEGLSGGRLMVGSGRCENGKGCLGIVQTAFPDEEVGFKIVEARERARDLCHDLNATREREQAAGESVQMATGDHILIPAHRKHRVKWTTPEEPTVWLAVFYRVENGRGIGE